MRHFIAIQDSCIVLEKSGYLLHKLKTIVDFLIKAEIYKPAKKFRKNVGINDTEEGSENQGVMDKHPFSGFQGTIVSLLSGLTYKKHVTIE